MRPNQRNNQFKNFRGFSDKPKKEWKPRLVTPPGCNYYAEVREGEDPMRAYRKIKKKINELLNSDIMEEKSYSDY